MAVPHNIQLPELPDTFSGIAYGVAGLAAACVVIARMSRRRNLDAFPSVGSSSFFGSWGAAFKFLTHGIDILREGYEKYKYAPFKVADKFGWIVIISDRKQLDELREASDDELSLLEVANHRLQARYVRGLHDILNPAYDVAVVRSHLARNVEGFFPEILDEMKTSFDEGLNPTGNPHEWKRVLAWNAVQKIICRTSNRVFVGLPLCRNPEWIDLNLRYTLDVVNTALSLASFPKFIRPLVAYFFTAVARDTRLGVKLLGPMVQDRLKSRDDSPKNSQDKWVEMPNDLVTWLATEGPELTVETLTSRALLINLTSVYMTAVSSTHAILYLAANPKYVQPLRDEVENAIKEQGWSNAALDKMYKVDSFLKECQRLQGVSAVSVLRVAVKDFKFSDGTLIPKGTMIGVANQCLQLDEMFYKDAHKFEPFRFAEMQRLDGEGDKHQFVTTSLEYQPFGHGKHACPGRFFAVTEMKVMIALIVTTYDIKLERGTAHCPRSLHTGHAIFPNPRSKVLFRRRIEPVD